MIFVASAAGTEIIPNLFAVDNMVIANNNGITTSTAAILLLKPAVNTQSAIMSSAINLSKTESATKAVLFAEVVA